jgi:NitT/TauT family transport system substrate-binding protein
MRWAMAACAVLALAAFPRPAVADDALTLVDIYPSSYFEVLPDVAERAGFFKEQHLTVTIQYAGNPAVAVQSVAAGKGDIASINSDGIILGYDKGVRMTAFLSHSPRFQDVLGVLETSPIRTLADFKGKVIGETSIGQPGEVFTRVLLAGAGLGRGDYTFAPIGIGAQAIAAITSGKADGLVQPLPQQRIYEVTGGLKFRYFFNPLLSDVPNSAWVTAPATIASKADALRRFSRAMVKASILIRVNPQLAARYFVEGAGGKVTDEAIADELRLLEATQDLLPAVDPTSTTIGLIPLRGVKVYTKFMYDNGLTAQLVPATAVVTGQFIPYANDFDHKAFIAQAKAMR